eukprot:TRINITY_DN20051_c0_g1_i1.p1 TRINITY_DN20051_c0_g1~~TRINITY_DN20051_c0_g1_i1.p1  ORF type:complete len:481 (+),score=136.87 TRINITY_DN20051_c0_g1_i1:48-1445(+)
MAVRRTQRLLRFSSVRQGYGGDVSRALKERQQFQQLRVDDEFRGALGLPTWLRTDADAERHERSKRERKQRVLSRKTEAPEDFGSLHSSGLSSHLCRVLRRQGITDLTDVQHELMKAVGSGTDIILQAHTGTGKSFGLILALAHMLVEDPPDLRFHALVLVPSAGLAGQMERWLRLYCGQSPHMCQLLTSDRSPQQNLANLQAVRPFVVISTPDELQLMASLAKEREKGTPGVMYQLRRNMQLLVIDEVDQVLPPDVGDPLHRSRTQLMQSIVRGSDTSTLGHSHWMPRQQVIAASATLTRHLHGHVRRWMRTELTGEVAAGPAQPSAGFSADGGRRRALVRCISGDGTVGTTNLQSCLPPQLHCALLMSTSAKDVAAAIRSIVQSFVDTGSFHTAYRRHATQFQRTVLSGAGAGGGDAADAAAGVGYGGGDHGRRPQASGRAAAAVRGSGTEGARGAQEQQPRP